MKKSKRIFVGCIILFVFLLSVAATWYLTKGKELPLDYEIKNIIGIKIEKRNNGICSAGEIAIQDWNQFIKKMRSIRCKETDYPENNVADEITIVITYKDGSRASIMFSSERVPQAIINEYENHIYILSNYNPSIFDEFFVK